MRPIRRLAPWPLLIALALAFASVPAGAVERPRPEPQGVGNLLKYAACAVSVAAAYSLLGMVGAFVNCARVLHDEIQRPS